MDRRSRAGAISVCATAIPARSSVFRVDGSNVRMPRSHRMISELPRCATYSAAWSHSSIVMARPRFSMTGLCVEPDLLQQLEVLRVPRPDADAVGDLGDVLHLRARRRPRRRSAARCRAGTPPGSRAPAPRGPGTSRATSAACRRRRAGSSRRRPRGRSSRGNACSSVSTAHGPGDDRERVAADRRRAHLHRGRCRVQVARDHLVRLADLDHVIDARQLLERDRLEPARCPRPEPMIVWTVAARDERLAAGGARTRLGDGLDVRLGCVALHDDDHRVPRLLWRLPRPPADLRVRTTG